MSRKQRILSPTGYYHIVTRGVGQQILFETDEDYLFFINRLQKCQEKDPFDIMAYCLMENHIHMLLRVDEGLDRIMKRILTSYAYYYNSKYERSGHVFQNRYTSQIVETEGYLLAIVRYIHNNPPKAGICSREEYPWSSWHEYIGFSKLTNTRPIIELVGGRESFLQFSKLPDDNKYLEADERQRISDTKAREIICNTLNLTSGTQIPSMNRVKRNAALRLLKKKGLSVRQMERLTGISRGIIQSACKKPDRGT